MSKTYTTALTAIVKNESRSITQLMESVRPYVDMLFVLDTGSTDDTVELARKAGAQVYFFEWCNDFSAARNTILAHSTADWNLVLDADERLVEGGLLLSGLRSVAPDFVAQVQVHSVFGEANDQFDTSWSSRLLPKGVRYQGIVHELPVHDYPTRRLDIVIGHDGYTKDNLVRKEGRNWALISTALQANPDDAYLWFQLGQEAQVRDQFVKAEECFARAFDLLADTPPWFITLVSSRIYTLKKLGQHDAGLNFGLDQLPKCLTSADVSFAIGDLLIDWAASEPTQAAQLVPHAIDAFLNCLDIGEHPEVNRAVAGRGSHLAAHNLALLYEVSGRDEDARLIREQYGLSKPD